MLDLLLNFNDWTIFTTLEVKYVSQNIQEKEYSKKDKKSHKFILGFVFSITVAIILSFLF